MWPDCLNTETVLVGPILLGAELVWGREVQLSFNFTDVSSTPIRPETEVQFMRSALAVNCCIIIL